MVKILVMLEALFTQDSKVEDLICGDPSGSEPSLLFSNYLFSFGYQKLISKDTSGASCSPLFSCKVLRRYIRGFQVRFIYSWLFVYLYDLVHRKKAFSYLLRCPINCAFD